MQQAAPPPPPPPPDAPQSRSAWPLPLHDTIDALGAAMDDAAEALPGREATNEEIAAIARTVVKASRALDAACDALVANPPAQESDILQAQAESEAARVELLEAYAELEGVAKSVSGVLDKVCEDCGEAAFRAGPGDDAAEEAEAPS